MCAHYPPDNLIIPATFLQNQIPLMSEKKVLKMISLLCPGSVLGAVCILITQVMLAYGLLTESSWVKPVASESLIIAVLILLYISLEIPYLLNTSRNHAVNPGDLR